MARLKNPKKEKRVDESIDELIKLRSNDYISKRTNGDIPVKYEYADMYYDIESGLYYVLTRIGNKKYTLMQVVDN